MALPLPSVMNMQRCWFYLRSSQGKESRCYHSRIHSYPCEELSIRADFVMLSRISVYFLLHLSRFLSTLQVPSCTRSLEGTLAFGDPRTQWIVACNRKLKTRTAVLLFVLGILPDILRTCWCLISQYWHFGTKSFRKALMTWHTHTLTIIWYHAFKLQ